MERMRGSRGGSLYSGGALCAAVLVHARLRHRRRGPLRGHMGRHGVPQLRFRRGSVPERVHAVHLRHPGLGGPRPAGHRSRAALWLVQTVIMVVSYAVRGEAWAQIAFWALFSCSSAPRRSAGSCTCCATMLRARHRGASARGRARADFQGRGPPDRPGCTGVVQGVAKRDYLGRVYATALFSMSLLMALLGFSPSPSDCEGMGLQAALGLRRAGCDFGPSKPPRRLVVLWAQACTCRCCRARGEARPRPQARAVLLDHPCILLHHTDRPGRAAEAAVRVATRRHN